MRATACPECGNRQSAVVDSRPYIFEGIPTIKRRRKCAACGHNTTTYELTEKVILTQPSINKLFIIRRMREAMAMKAIDAITESLTGLAQGSFADEDE